MSRSGAFLVVIPARFASSRLHGKPLADIGGKPMVVRVAERARASGAEAVWVATDNQSVFDAVRLHGHQAMMTRTEPRSVRPLTDKYAIPFSMVIEHLHHAPECSPMRVNYHCILIILEAKPLLSHSMT